MSDKPQSVPQLKFMVPRKAAKQMRTMGIEEPWSSFSQDSPLGDALVRCFRLSPDRVKWAHPGTWSRSDDYSWPCRDRKGYSPFLCYRLPKDENQIFAVMGNDGYVLNRFYLENTGMLRVDIVYHRECASTEEATRYLDLWEVF